MLSLNVPGILQPLLLLLKLQSRNHKFIIVATYKQPPVLDIFMMSRKELHIDISWTYYDVECEQAIKLLDEHKKLFSPLVTHVFLLEDTDTAMQYFINGGDTLKVSIKVAQP